tara:strand:- start:117 stop:1223 length:1107 start_codon:yes stop_codon:yes gene_type:complete
MALNGTLTNERKLTAGTNITITDGGAGGNVTIAASGGAASFPLEAPNGSVGTPSYSFSTDTNTGMYLTSGDTLSFAATGIERLRISASGLQVIPDGTAATPGISFTGNTNTGFYQPAASEIAVSANGAETFRFGADGDIEIVGDPGAAGQVLTSGGASSAAEWTTPAGGSFSPELVGVELDQAGTGYAVFDILSLPPYGNAFFATGAIDTKQYFFPWIAPKSGNISDVLVNFTSGAGSATDVYYSFYRDNSGVPSTVLGYVTANGQTTGVQTLTSFSSTVTVVRGTQYWLGQNKSTTQSITMRAFNNSYRPRIAPYEAFPSTTTGYGTSLTTNSDVSGTPADITAEGLEPGIFFAGLGAAPHIGIKIV